MNRPEKSWLSEFQSLAIYSLAFSDGGVEGKKKKTCREMAVNDFKNFYGSFMNFSTGKDPLSNMVPLTSTVPTRK